MKGLMRHILPLSLRVRFLLATAAVVLVLSLSYGMVALVGYSVSFDKTTFRLLRGESNLFYMLAKWENDTIVVDIPENLNMQSPTVTLIYNANGRLLWAQHDVPWLTKRIQPEWLKNNGFHEIETDISKSSMLQHNNHEIQQQLDAIREEGDDTEMTHSVAINIYPATSTMPQLSIVVVDTIPVELKNSYMVWSWFIYVLAANLLLVIPLLWVAAWWSLRPIESLAKEVRELEEHHREMLNPNTTRELTRLVSNLNRLLKSERERYNKYRTTLTDLTHSLKTPLAVMQSTLRSMRGGKLGVNEAEPIMLEQISRISQQIGYYLHRASMRSGRSLLSRELHPIAPLLDNLTSALNKVYQRKGVNITLDISPEISFVGEKNDFMEVMGNVLDNACKYCLEFVEVSVRQTNDNALHILVEDDGPGIPQSLRNVVFDRGQRADTLRPGQGVGLAVARDIVEQYDGRILTEESLLGGACMEVIFGRQFPEDKES
ncbi:two-component system sensor histidine kinase PhoQ [Klebsiella indica]|uniref:histidine kinase n=1 Tax=Klebsiella indica TaxID=2582917 RepID=A0A5R9LH65_9ENTR|nr:MULTISPECIES: two-component system sensor histidine kinase PhoQ [Klebsiella]TLV16718.1 two-component system sensor histidine kinase PhoQ [Klebsiella indica]